jgi:predicted unusual protein kinase regulating ubiquinone biosynthesis (AarF/ABC1/UbiB family)
MAKKIVETWLMNESEEILSERMSELDRVGEKIAQVGFAQQQDPAARIYMQTLLSEYFARLSPASKKLIVGSFLGTNLFSTDLEKFSVMVQNSGPMLQKLLQIVARQANLPAEVQDIFKKLESSVRPVPWHIVQKMLEKEKANYEFVYFERTPIGVGTMAQVHRAKVMMNGVRTDVVVRFIKPGMEERVAEDRRIMYEIAPILDNNEILIKMQVPKMTPIVEDLATTVTAENDQEATKERQKAGKVYEITVPFNTKSYKTELEFHVPTIFDSKNPSKFMVQEMILGDKLDAAAESFADTVPELKVTVIEAMTRRWVEVALFGNGFYHSDLHPGNTKIEVKEPRFVLNILDFGMGGVIPAEMQRQVMVLGVGTDILNGDLIGRAFWGLSDKKRNHVTEQDFKKLVNEKAARIRAGKEPNISMEMWMAWALNNGMGLPYEFVSLNRGMAFLNKLLSDAGSKLDITKITKNLARQNPGLVYDNLVVKEKVSMEDLAKLGWSEVKNVFQKGTPKVTSFTLPTGGRCEAVFN